MTSKTVGILTWHYYGNFGSALQAYALQETLRSMGNNVEIINYRNPVFGQNNWYWEKVRGFISNLASCSSSKIADKVYSPFLSFRYRYLSETPVAYTLEKLQKIIRNYNVVICGSDQVWAPNVLNPVYLLTFIPSEITKISYAASIGLNSIPNEMVHLYREALEDFKAVSVRENDGAKLLKTTCGIDAEVVLDPTLLIDTHKWINIEKEVNGVEQGKYIFCYFLNEKHDYKKNAIEYANKEGFEIVGISHNKADYSWMRVLKNIGPCEFLWLIHNAASIITDSYHGTIFSLLYHKKFLTLERFKNSDNNCQNSRIYQLKSYFGLFNQIVSNNENISWVLDDVDYTVFENKLGKLREKSTDYIEIALR